MAEDYERTGPRASSGMGEDRQLPVGGSRTPLVVRLGSPGGVDRL